MKTIQVRVKPGARVSEFRPGENGTWLASVRARPVEGEANAEVIRLVADHFGCPRGAVTLKRGDRSRIKYLVVPGE
jgi:hypothetical protein